MTAIRALPPFLLIMACGAALMIVPAAYAYMIEEHHDARTFLYAAILGLVLTSLLALALANRGTKTTVLRQLVALAAAFVFLPVMFAVPFHEAVRTTSFVSAYFEMVSSFTTTGATVFESARLSGPEHLWRALVGWLGGMLIWVAASAVMAPLALGGFEVTAVGQPGQASAQGAANLDVMDPNLRLWRSIEALVPIYVGLTLALMVMLLMSGDPALVAVSHAMSVMATSGISPLSDLSQAPSGLAGEMILFCFLFFGLSRLTFASDTGNDSGLLKDPEFRLGLVVIAVVPVALFFRHWAAAFDIGDEQNWLAGLRALWGSLFTALSFLSTTGFLSGDWETAQNWSGLPTPGLILLGLALIGGGVATTAGGVKLLRVYMLYLNGKREIERLIHPSSVGRAGTLGRRVRREGTFIAWVFFMLFAVTLAGLTMLLGVFGIGLEHAIVLSIASLANTGPLIAVAPAQTLDVIALAPAAKLVLCVAMVLGRLELLAIIVMLSPDIWRD